jgi:predicted alpha/beta-hydrolase family hydrolase
MLLFPGAGSSAEHSSLVAIERAAAPRRVVRADFPYRRQGRRAPDRAPVLLAAVRDELASFDGAPVVLGGRSMGGRVCSMVVAGADGSPPPPNARGLILISYPLHPPGKPDRLRVEHLGGIRVPCLFVHGTSDPFATPDELTAWTATIPAPVTHVWIDGGRHDLARADDRIAAVVVDWLAELPGRRRRGGRS